MPNTSAHNNVASSALGIANTVNTATFDRCRAVWIGTTQALDFCFDGTNWVAFKACQAGTVIPIQVVGARITSGTAAPAAGDVVFLY